MIKKENLIIWKLQFINKKMEKKFYILLAIVSVLFFKSQSKINGEEFDWDLKKEKEMKIAISDDYSIYLFSVISDGIVGGNKIIARKFDQKCNFTNAITEEFGKTVGTLSNFLGSAEIDKNRFVIFTEEYNGKAKKKEIWQYVFDRTDDQFKSSVVATYPIESAMKSGNTYVKFSENGKYAAIINDRYSTKKTENTIDNTVLDLKSLDKKWEKSVTLDSDYNEMEFAVTNSARILTFRKANGWKQSYKLLQYSADDQKEIPVEDKLVLKSLYPFTINDNDYLLSFGFYNVPRADSGDFNYAIFMNLQDGAAKVTKVPAFSEVSINEIEPSAFAVKNSTVSTFLNIRRKFVPKETPGNMFPEPIYSYGPKAYFMALSLDGEVKVNEEYSYDHMKGKLGVFKDQDVVYTATNGPGDVKLFKYDPNVPNSRPKSIGNQIIVPTNIKNVASYETIGNLTYFVPSVNRVIGFFIINNEKPRMFSIYNWIK